MTKFLLKKYQKSFSKISSNLGPELAPPPSPEELTAFANALKVRSDMKRKLHSIQPLSVMIRTVQKTKKR